MVSFMRITAASAAALCAVASLTEAIDKQLYGINFDLRRGPDWDANKCKSASTIASELKTLSSITKRVRTYALTDCDVRPVLTNAKSLGMTVWLGVWVAADGNIFKNEVATAQKLVDDGLIDDNVVGFNVGSEAVYRGDITAEEAIAYITSFKEFLATNSLTKPVAITDIIDTLLLYPDLVAAGDVVTINQFPFWERVKASDAANQFKSRIQPLLELAAGKEVIITETGWSTAGKNENASDSTAAGAAQYMNDFYELATAEGWKYYYFQGFDSAYKAEMEKDEDSVEGSFGIFTADGKMKPAYAALKFGDASTISKDTTQTTKTPSSSSGSASATEEESGSGSKKTEAKSGSTTEDDGPGTVNTGSENGAAGGASANSNSTSKTKKPSTSEAATSAGLARGLSIALVVVSLVLGNL